MAKYTGGFITSTEVLPAGEFANSVASGVWTLQEALMYHKAGIFPVSGSVNALAFIATDTTTIDKLSLTTQGNATSFGTLSVSNNFKSALGSTTRFVLSTLGNSSNVIEFMVMADGGSTSDFGDLTVTRGQGTGGCNATRGLFSGGYNGSSRQDVIDYLTIASEGNATDFGDLAAASYSGTTITSTSRAVITAGRQGSTVNNIYYVTIASTGNTSAFGDLTQVQVKILVELKQMI